jgi:hypothetical protein
MKAVTKLCSEAVVLIISMLLLSSCNSIIVLPSIDNCDKSESTNVTFTYEQISKTSNEVKGSVEVRVVEFGAVVRTEGLSVSKSEVKVPIPANTKMKSDLLQNKASNAWVLVVDVTKCDGGTIVAQSTTPPVGECQQVQR